MSHSERKQMIDRDHKELSVSKQCAAVGIARGCVYYQPKLPDQQSLALMRRMDELFMCYPFYGSRQMASHLKRDGIHVGRRRVRRLMQLMGLQAIYQKPRTSTPNPAHKIYPYLLRNMKITDANHVWCTDITYIPMQNGFLYLVVVMDWATRHVLSWRLSNTLEASFCIEALEEALLLYGAPKIFNTDQGAQFTSLAFTGALRGSGIQISMDGRGRCMDNIFIERLWRSLKYEAVYLTEMTDGFTARRVIGQWLDFYSHIRPHSSLDGGTPHEAYWQSRTLTQDLGLTPDPVIKKRAA
jgi:putative transposase